MLSRKDITELVKENDTENLKIVLDAAENMEILHAFHDLLPEKQIIVFDLLEKNSALFVFKELDTDEQQNLLRSFPEEKIIEFVSELAPDDRVRLLEGLFEGMRDKIISSLPPAEQADTNILMSYKPETAGRIMTTKYISLESDITVEQAIASVREQALNQETIYTLYVKDADGKLLGVLSLKELLTTDGNAKIESIMLQKPIRVSADTDQEEAARLLQTMDFLSLPVVDENNKMLGIVTIDDAMNVLEEETTEDIYDQAGLADITSNEQGRSEVLIFGNLWDIWKVRLPFLLATLGLGMLSGIIIDVYEEVLAKVTAVAIFIPVIMGMGGNIGTQSSAVFARAVVLKHIKIKKFVKPFLKEIGVGFSIGVLVGLISGAIATFWLGMPMLGVAVGLAMAITMTTASMLGFLIPYILIRLNIDQAAGSAPIITTLKDFLALLIYFVSVSIFLGNML
ncbi:MAG: magnesium transporter [Chitinivibrionia bacterium]|nr:magnesium transporter [Chitinivibrionia bacterium]